MNAPHTRILSVNGSRLRPTSDSGPYFRAHQPSTQSVTHATTNTTSATSHAALTVQANTTTASGMRTSDSALGTLTSGSWAGGGAAGEGVDMAASARERVVSRSLCGRRGKRQWAGSLDRRAGQLGVVLR